MPKPLVDRCRPDCIAEFRESARQRFDDGLVAAANDRRTAAIYLWGYAAEMALKAAYFDAIGFASEQEIKPEDLNDAVRFGQASMVLWPRRGRLHCVRAWAETLVIRRGSASGTAYDRPGFGPQVAREGQRLERYWSETLRYHKNVAYHHEVRRVRKSTEWFLTNMDLL